MNEGAKKPSTVYLYLAVAAGVCLASAMTISCATSTTRILIGFCGLQLFLVQGTLVWLARIAAHPDLDASGREQNKNAVLVAATFLSTIGLGLMIVCLATASVFKAGTSTALLWAIGSLLGGGFIGFLFSLPKPAENSASQNPGARWEVNNSLNRISDALTAALVGVTLVNAQAIYDHFVKSVGHLGRGLSTAGDAASPAASAFAAGLIVAFFLLGLLGTYLLTRLWIAAALAQAEPSATNAFVGTGIDERDLAILENETRSFSERGRVYTGAAESVAARIKDLSMDRLRTWRDYAAWGKAKSQFGQHEEAETAFVKAVQLYPESPELRLEFAVSLFLACLQARQEKRTEVYTQLNVRVQEQLTEAYDRLDRKTSAEVCKNVIKSLTYYWLYQPAPAGFLTAIKYGEEYVKNPGSLPSGGIWVNLACAYGQNVSWLIAQGGEPKLQAGLRENISKAITRAKDLDVTWLVKFQELLEPKIEASGDEPPEDDLGAFADDEEIRVLIGLPAKRRPKPDSDHPQPSVLHRHETVTPNRLRKTLRRFRRNCRNWRPVGGRK
jgi:hypothetical protein